jgi:DNA-binding CsgD family transcriptional regulator
VASLNAEQLAEVTSVLFAAALDQSRWQDFLTRLSTHAGIVSTHLYGYDLATNFALNPLYHGYDPAFMKSYTAHYGALNAWAEGLGRTPVGKPITSAECLPEEELFKTEFYNDWLRPQGDVRAGVGVVLARDSSRFFVLGGNMAQRHAHREADWFRTIGLLAPHMCMSLEIGRTLFDGAAHAAFGVSAATGTGGAVFAVTPRRKVLYANSAALFLAETGRVLAYDHAGRIAFADPEADAALGAALSKLHWMKGPMSGSIRAQDSQGDVRVIRFARIESERLGYIPVGIQTNSGEPLLLVSIRLDEGPSALRKTLRERFGLTESETAVAMLIGNGLQADEIAQQRDVSVHTVRDQIKASLRKTGAARQAGLVRMLHELQADQSR